MGLVFVEVTGHRPGGDNLGFTIPRYLLGVTVFRQNMQCR